MFLLRCRLHARCTFRGTEHLWSQSELPWRLSAICIHILSWRRSETRNKHSQLNVTMASDAEKRKLEVAPPSCKSAVWEYFVFNMQYDDKGKKTVSLYRRISCKRRKWSQRQIDYRVEREVIQSYQLLLASTMSTCHDYVNIYVHGTHRVLLPPMHSRLPVNLWP